MYFLYNSAHAIRTHLKLQLTIIPWNFNCFEGVISNTSLCIVKCIGCERMSNVIELWRKSPFFYENSWIKGGVVSDCPCRGGTEMRKHWKMKIAPAEQKVAAVNTFSKQQLHWQPGQRNKSIDLRKIVSLYSCSLIHIESSNRVSTRWGLSIWIIFLRVSPIITYV